jgi:hypothetical protein
MKNKKSIKLLKYKENIFENEKLKINQIIETQNKKILIFENEKIKNQ